MYSFFKKAWSDRSQSILRDAHTCVHVYIYKDLSYFFVICRQYMHINDIQKQTIQLCWQIVLYTFPNVLNNNSNSNSNGSNRFGDDIPWSLSCDPSLFLRWVTQQTLWFRGLGFSLTTNHSLWLGSNFFQVGYTQQLSDSNAFFGDLCLTKASTKALKSWW